MPMVTIGIVLGVFLILINTVVYSVIYRVSIGKK